MRAQITRPSGVRRGLFAASVLGLAMALVASCTGSRATATHTSTLSIGADLTYPPYDYSASGKPAGFDPDFMNALATQLRMTPKFVDTRFAQLIPSLNSGKFDVIASALYITAERAKQVDYIPYLTTGSSIVALIADHNAPSTLAGLCGKRVSIIKGAAVAEDMRKESTGVCRGAKPIDVREYPTDPEATEALLSGHVDVQVTDAAVAKDVVAKNASKLKISSTTLLYPIPVGLAVKKGNAKLESQLKQALAALDKAGTYQSLLQRYNLEPPNQQQVAAILGG